MITRQITVTSTKTQRTDVFESHANTLGELKAELRDRDISYEDMEFFEGISKSILIDDESLLPHDQQWKGRKTDNLLIILTSPKKKIKNGSEIKTRTDAYALIRSHNFSKEVEKKLGNNYTRCKTSDLLKFCNDKLKAAQKKASKTTKKCGTEKKSTTSTKSSNKKTCSYKIKVSALDRKTLFSLIKEQNLQEAIKQAAGKVYSSCSTETLVKLVEKLLNAPKACAKKTVKTTTKKIEKPKNFFSDEDIAKAIEIRKKY